MTLRLNGSTSGYTEIDTPATASNNLLTLPNANSTLVSASGMSGILDFSGATVRGAGLDLITSNTFTGSSAVNVNNCFTSTYDSYRVMLDVTAMSTTLDVLLRLRVSAADNSTTNYSRQIVYGNGSTAYAEKATAQTSWTVMQSSSANAENCKFIVDIFAPNLARRTIGNLQWMSVDSVGNLLAFVANISFTATTTFDGFSLVPSTGNFSGTVRIYGYRN